MCGRYSVIIDEDAVSRTFKAEPPRGFGPHYNASPGQTLPVIASHQPDQVQLFRWGFIPAWAKDESTGYKMINARADGITEKASFKKAVQSQQCLVLANSFFEWQQNSIFQKAESPVFSGGKTPYLIRVADQPLFAMAGIWNRWVNYSTGEEIATFAIITTEANELMHAIHDRMPVILDNTDALRWIDPAVPLAQKLPMLKPYDAAGMEAFEVGKEVNKTIHDYPRLIQREKRCACKSERAIESLG